MKIFASVDNGAVFSAYGNDNSYDQTFVEQLKNLLEGGDLVISLSVSGSSGNLVESHRYAKEMGAKTICIVGGKNGELIRMSDFSIVIKSMNYGIVDSKEGKLIFAPYEKWENIPVASFLSERFHQLDVFCENDVNACAVGEQMFGLGKSTGIISG